MEIFKNAKSHGKWKDTITNMTCQPNIKCDVPGNTLIHMQQVHGLCKVGYLSQNFCILSWKSHEM